MAYRFFLPQLTKTTGYSLITTDAAVISNGSSLSHVLASAVDCAAGFTVIIKNIHSTACTLTSAAGNIERQSTIAVPPSGSYTFLSDGTNWWII